MNSEAKRILGLASKPVPDLRRYSTAQGAQLRPVQSDALREIEACGGLLGGLGGGDGKTLVSLLAAHVLDVSRALILVPAPLVEKTKTEAGGYFERFIRPRGRIYVVSYARISTTPDLLEEIRPELIIADEAHRLKHATTARTKRVRAYLRTYPGCAFVALSGSFADASIREYAHLAQWALGDGSPLPLERSYLESWAEVLDPDGAPSGADRAAFEPMLSHVGEEPREALRRVLQTVRGVVFSSVDDVGASLNICALRPALPDCLVEAIEHLEATWETPGRMLATDAHVAQARRQLALGFYYVLDWPDGVEDAAWVNAHNAWGRAVRRYLRYGRKYDTELLVRQACERGDAPNLECMSAWAAWSRERHKPEPPRRAVWIDRSVVEFAAAWLEDHENAIVWYSHRAVAAALDEMGATVAYPGQTPPESGSVALSVASHSTGLNLQSRNEQLVLTPPSSGKTWEQLLGRTHRPGQSADEVWCWYLDHTGGINKAIERARFVAETQGTAQKLLIATHT